MSKLTLKTEGDTHIVVTRRFAATPEAVYRAHTELVLAPNLLEQLHFGSPVHRRLRSGLLPATEYSVLPTVGQFK